MNPKQCDLQPQCAALPSTVADGLLNDLRQMIDHARASVASTINAGLTMTYWRVGNRVLKEILQGERAGYGKSIVVTLSRQLVCDYGNGFTEKNLRRMIQFAEVFPDEQIVASLARQLSWSHFSALLTTKDDIKRDFYAEMCRVERWNVRTLRGKIDSMLFERTALSKKPEAVVRRADCKTPPSSGLCNVKMTPSQWLRSLF